MYHKQHLTSHKIKNYNTNQAMMISKKILVYDSSGAYSRFIKIKYSDCYTVDSFSKFDNDKEIKFCEYDIAFFIINREIDVFDFIRISNKVPVLIIGTSIPEVRKRLIGLQDTIMLDLQKIKSEIIESIDFYLNTL